MCFKKDWVRLERMNTDVNYSVRKWNNEIGKVCGQCAPHCTCIAFYTMFKQQETSKSYT